MGVVGSFAVLFACLSIYTPRTACLYWRRMPRTSSLPLKLVARPFHSYLPLNMTNSFSCKNALLHSDSALDGGTDNKASNTAMAGASSSCEPLSVATAHGALEDSPDAGVADQDGTNPHGGRAGLRELQRRAGGQFVEFAGHSTPVRYADGIIKEHMHTRSAAGLFDVSHMNQVRVVGAGAAQALEALMPADLIALSIGRMRYTVLTGIGGGILDDIIITRTDEHTYTIVSNACRAQAINAWLGKHLGQRLNEYQGGRQGEHRGERQDGRVQWHVVDDEVLLAIQGPQARAVVSALATEARALKPMHTATITLAGYVCSVACAGYTGEDGFECSIPTAGAVQVVQALTADSRVRWCGLGARDSLRLEAGLCLYGSDISEDCTPVEAGLGWTVARSRRTGGARAGGFAGADKILSQLENGYDRLDKRLRGLVSLERVLAREGAHLYDSADSTNKSVGSISSGAYSPSLKCSIALAWLPASYMPGQTVYAHVRNRRIPFQISELPFYSPRRKTR